MQSRIQRSGLHLKHISGLQTQSLDNAISMLRSPLQRLKNEHVECSLQQLNPVLIMTFLVHGCRHSTRSGSRLSTAMSWGALKDGKTSLGAYFRCCGKFVAPALRKRGEGRGTPVSC